MRRVPIVHLATALCGIVGVTACGGAAGLSPSSPPPGTEAAAESLDTEPRAAEPAATEPPAVPSTVATTPTPPTAPTAPTAPTTGETPDTAPDRSMPAASTDPPTTSSSAPPAGGYTSAITHEVIDNPAFDSMETRVVGLLQRAGLPGASLVVVQHGVLVEQEAWLDYDLDTVVPIASATKWLTAALVMTLVDDGLIDLDAPISTYAPGAAGYEVGTITMRMLLSFTSGLVADESVPCFDDPDATLLGCATTILQQGTIHTPGTRFRYHGSHMHVAGAIAELVTGQSFVGLLNERILQPLGMTRTGMLQVGDYRLDDVTHPSPAGTAVSTLGDYARFLEMIVHEGVAPDGTVVLTAESVAEMQRNQIADADYGRAAEFRMQLESPYGLGEWLDWTDEDGSALVLSSDGKFGFRPWIDRENDLFGVYLVYDQGEGYVEGDPDAPVGAATGPKVHTSGLWIFEWAAEALGGSLPEVYYPDRV